MGLPNVATGVAPPARKPGDPMPHAVPAQKAPPQGPPPAANPPTIDPNAQPGSPPPAQPQR